MSEVALLGFFADGPEGWRWPCWADLRREIVEMIV